MLHINVSTCDTYHAQMTCTCADYLVRREREGPLPALDFAKMAAKQETTV